MFKRLKVIGEAHAWQRRFFVADNILYMKASKVKEISYSIKHKHIYIS